MRLPIRTFALLPLIASLAFAQTESIDTPLTESVKTYIATHPRKTKEATPRPWDFPFHDNAYVGLLSEVLAGESNDEAKSQIEAVIKLCQSFGTNATRKDLLREFTTQGGFSHRTAGVYVYKTCPTIKIDVKFSPVGPESASYPLADKILKISPPYVGYVILD